MVKSRARALSSLAVAGLLASILIAVGQGPVSATHRAGTAVKGSASPRSLSRRRCEMRTASRGNKEG